MNGQVSQLKKNAEVDHEGEAAEGGGGKPEEAGRDSMVCKRCMTSSKRTVRAAMAASIPGEDEAFAEGGVVGLSAIIVRDESTNCYAKLQEKKEDFYCIILCIPHCNIRN